MLASEPTLPIPRSTITAPVPFAADLSSSTAWTSSTDGAATGISCAPPTCLDSSQRRRAGLAVAHITLHLDGDRSLLECGQPAPPLPGPKAGTGGTSGGGLVG